MEVIKEDGGDRRVLMVAAAMRTYQGRRTTAKTEIKEWQRKK
jgi:hypothetical protein